MDQGSPSTLMTPRPDDIVSSGSQVSRFQFSSNQGVGSFKLTRGGC